MPSKSKTVVLASKEPVVMDVDPKSYNGVLFMGALLRRLMNEASGDILHICINSAAAEVGLTSKQAERLVKLAIKNRNANNPLYASGFLP